MKLDPPINKQNVPELVGGLSLTTAGSMRTDDTYNPIHYEGELVAWPRWKKMYIKKENPTVQYRST